MCEGKVKGRTEEGEGIREDLQNREKNKRRGETPPIGRKLRKEWVEKQESERGLYTGSKREKYEHQPKKKKRSQKWKTEKGGTRVWTNEERDKK